MMFDVSIKQEFSILLDIDGVSFYVGDDESPTITLPIQNLVNEFLDSRSIAEIVCDIDDVVKVKNALQDALNEIEIALETAEHGETK